MRVCSGVPRQGLAFHAGVVDYHKDTSPIIIFNLINQEIRTKCVLNWITWLVIGVAECRRWREPYQTGKTVWIHIKQNIQRGTVSVMVSYP